MAQAFLNVGGVSCTFEIYAPETERAVEKMDVTINESREHQFSARVDHFCARAARVLDFLIVTDGHDLAVSNGHGLSPRLLGVFRVNPAANDDDIRRFDDLFLRLRHRGCAKQKQQRLKNDAKQLSFHRHLVLQIRMSVAC